MPQHALVLLWAVSLARAESGGADEVDDDLWRTAKISGDDGSDNHRGRLSKTT